MTYKEFEEKIKSWGEKYNYKPVIITNTNIIIYIMSENDNNVVCAIKESERFVVDLNWSTYRNLSDDARNHLFEIVTEFAKTPIEDREDKKRFIIPLPELVTSDNKQQYLTHADGTFFASRRDETLRQTWKEEYLKFVPEVYRQFAEEFDEGKEY